MDFPTTLDLGKPLSWTWDYLEKARLDQIQGDIADTVPEQSPAGHDLGDKLLNEVLEIIEKCQ